MCIINFSKLFKAVQLKRFMILISDFVAKLEVHVFYQNEG